MIIIHYLRRQLTIVTDGTACKCHPTPCDRIVGFDHSAFIYRISNWLVHSIQFSDPPWRGAVKFPPVGPNHPSLPKFNRRRIVGQPFPKSHSINTPPVEGAWRAGRPWTVGRPHEEGSANVSGAIVHQRRRSLMTDLCTHQASSGTSKWMERRRMY